MQNGLLSILIPFLTNSAKKPEGAGRKTILGKGAQQKSFHHFFFILLLN